MSKERNKTKKKNRIKKQNDFFNKKTSFVAGISVMAICVNDTLELVKDIPKWVNICEFLLILLILYLTLCTKKCDKVLASEGVDKFGSYLTIFSVIEFLLSRILISLTEDVELKWVWTNERLQDFIVLSAFSSVGIMGSIGLLLYSWLKK